MRVLGAESDAGAESHINELSRSERTSATSRP